MPTSDPSGASPYLVDSLTKSRTLCLVGHGSIGILLGLLLGYGLIFSVLGKIEIWPLISIDGELPGSSSAWRAAHTGPIMNGLLCIAGAFAVSILPLTNSQQRFVTWGLVYTVWANLVFYLGGIFGNAHSLTGGSTEKFGDANIYDLIGFVPALFAAIITPVCMVIIARAAYRAYRAAAT